MNVPLLITAKQYFDLPEPKGPFTFELHFGELVRVDRGTLDHYFLQGLIRDLLKQLLDRQEWFAEIELPYSLSMKYDHRAADVSVLSRKRLGKPPYKRAVVGAPDLAIFIKAIKTQCRVKVSDILNPQEE